MNKSKFTVLVILALAGLFFCTCVSTAESAALPSDYLEGGKPPKADGWTFEGDYPVSYEDSTIQVSFRREMISHKLYCGGKEGETAEDESWIVRIKIKDVSQFRTAVAMDTYEGDEQEDAESMANKKNAVVAMEADFFKYFYDVGYVVRQGELIRDATDNSRDFIYDMLIVDSEGDFHVVYSAMTEKIDAYVKEILTPNGRTILHTFNCGPVLVLNGRAQDVTQSRAAYQESYEWRLPCQRICIAQTGPLEYAIVEIFGEGHETTGLTMAEFAEFVAEKCPDAIVAYNLSGGHSTSIIARKNAEAAEGERICLTPTPKKITDILYFASAED